MVSIRLARAGSKRRPFYHLIVTDSRNSRDGRFIERIGFFNPIATGQEESMRINEERLTYWQAHGARPTDAVRKLIRRAGKSAAAQA